MCDWLGSGTAVLSCGRSTGLELGELAGPRWSFSGPSSWRRGTVMSCAFLGKSREMLRCPVDGSFSSQWGQGLHAPGWWLFNKWAWGAGRGVWHVARSAPLLSSVHRRLGSPVLNMGTAFSRFLWPLIVTDGMVAFGLTFTSISVWGFQDILSCLTRSTCRTPSIFSLRTPVFHPSGKLHHPLRTGPWVIYLFSPEVQLLAHTEFPQTGPRAM